MVGPATMLSSEFYAVTGQLQRPSRKYGLSPQYCTTRSAPAGQVCCLDFGSMASEARVIAPEARKDGINVFLVRRPPQAVRPLLVLRSALLTSN